MYSVLVLFHVVACFALILIVLLQTGRGAEMGAAFGGASQTLFGGGGGNTFLSKLTTGAAIVFMLTCLSLSYLSSGPSTKSIMENVPAEAPQQGPVLPEAKPVQPMPESSGAVNPGPSPAPPQSGAEAPPVTEPLQPTPGASQTTPPEAPKP